MRNTNLSYRISLLAIFTGLTAPYWTEAKQIPREANCTSAREFVTALEYLRDEGKEFKISETQAREVASKVMEGCTGAASRFIRVTKVLTRAGVPADHAIKTALPFARNTDQQTETFLSVFKAAYLAEYLDLDMRTSLNLASSLMNDFGGDAERVRADFLNLVEFCVQSENLGLPKPKCADFAASVAKKGERFGGGISNAFVRAYRFITSPDDGPGLTVAKGLEVSEALVASGPHAVENFIVGFKYASSESGMAFSKDDALLFANKIAQNTLAGFRFPEAPSDQKQKSLKVTRKLAEEAPAEGSKPQSE